MQEQKPKKSTDNPAEIQPKVKPRGRPFQKGQSGNPKGKPKGTLSLLSILKKELQEIPKELKGKERKRYADLLIKKQIHKAIVEGDTASIQLIWNYIEGSPKHSIDANLLGEIIFKWKNEKKSK